jgi:hypothetical protein
VWLQVPKAALDYADTGQARKAVQERRAHLIIGVGQPQTFEHSIPSPVFANDEVQQWGRTEGLRASNNRNAGPVCCNGWLAGPGVLSQKKVHQTALSG